MKSRWMRITSITISIAFLMSCVSCATGNQSAVKTANDVQRPVIEDDKMYTVKFREGKKYKVRGRDIALRGELISIRFEGEDESRHYTRQQIEEITEKSSKGMAMGIGAAVGGVVGAGLGAGLFYALTEPRSGSGFPHCSDPGDCAAMGHLGGTIMIGILGGLAGAAAGAGIGAAVAPKKKVIIAPQVNHRNGNTSAGVGISGSF